MPPRIAQPPRQAMSLAATLPYVVFFAFVYVLFFGHSSRKTATKIATRVLPPPPPRQPSMHRQPICALPNNSPKFTDENGCPEPLQCGGAFYTNYQAEELLQLDVNSHHKPPEEGWRGTGDDEGDDRPLPPVATAADCCRACREFNGPQGEKCSVWVYCAEKRYGCGECFPQVSNYNAKQAVPGSSASSRFGPYGGCDENYGSFPFRTCSLKTVKTTTTTSPATDPRSVKPSNYDDFDSWISGAIGLEEEVKVVEEKKEDEKRVTAGAEKGAAGGRKGGGG